MNASSLRNLQFVTNISSHPEIRILINALRHQTHDIILTKYVFKWWRSCRNSLHCRICYFPTIVWILQSKNSPQLRISDFALEFTHILVHVSHIFWIQENECFIHIKSTSNDVLSILNTISLIFLQRDFSFVKEFFIISQLNHHRHIKSFLQVFCEDKRHQMPYVHRITWRTTPSIKIESLSFFIWLQYSI